MSEVIELVFGELALAPVSLCLSSDHGSWIELVGVRAALALAVLVHLNLKFIILNFCREFQISNPYRLIKTQQFR